MSVTETVNRAFPEREQAEMILEEAEKCNPGPWGDHSRVVAKCAEAIAGECDGLDAEKAYVLGLMHDIGRKFGVGHMVHVCNGYEYMTQLGYSDAARICMSHSFCTKRFEDYVGNADISSEQRQMILEFLDCAEFDEYDLLIQFCDAIGLADGAVSVEERMNDVKSRYGRYPQAKWDKNIKLKNYFENKTGKSIESIVFPHRRKIK